MDIEAEIVSLSGTDWCCGWRSAMRVEERFVAADVPCVCPDMPS